MKYKLLLIIFIILILTGCKAKELENREFVMILAVDKTDDYDVYILTADNKVYHCASQSLNKALRAIDRQTSGQLYLGHIQGVIINNGIKDEITNIVNDNMNIGRDIPVMKCSNINELITSKNNDELRDYITQYFKNYDYKKINIETYINSNERNKNLPVITLKDNNFSIN